MLDLGRTRIGWCSRSAVARMVAISCASVMFATGCGGTSFSEAGDVGARESAVDGTVTESGVDGGDMDAATDASLQPVVIVANRTAMPQAMSPSVVLERPAEAVPGDLLFAVAVFNQWEAAEGMIVTPDNGWRLVRAEAPGVIFWRFATATDPMTFTFRRPMDAGGGRRRGVRCSSCAACDPPRSTTRRVRRSRWTGAGRRFPSHRA